MIAGISYDIVMISIITVNWNSYDFLDLLIESIELYTQLPYHLLVIDNSIKKQAVVAKNTFHFPMATNIGHGRGLNHGVAKSFDLFPNDQFIMFLDVDCHLLKHGWEAHFLSKMSTCDVIGGRGVTAKPIRPACMFMKKDIGRYDWCDTKAYGGHRKTPEGYDVAILAYYRMSADNVRIGFLERKPNRYQTLNGEEWCINGVPLVYHHWHGSHLMERQEDFPNSDLQADKRKLFGRIPWRLP